MKKTSLVVIVILVFSLFVIGKPGYVSSQIETKIIQIHGGSLTNHECNSEVWHFIINQLSDKSLAPPYIDVTWENGAQERVYLGEPRESSNAHYSTTSNLDSRVVSATAEIYSSWSGQFNLSHGPCSTPTPTLTNTPTSTATNTLTSTPTSTVTATPTPTDTLTATPTSTGTITATPKPTNTPKVTETPKNTTPTVVPNTPTATKELPLPGGTDPRGPSLVAFLVGISLILGTSGFILIRRRKII